MRAGRQAGRIATLLALSLLLTSCSAMKLGYENLPRLVEWQVDRFLSLDDDQEALVIRHAKVLQRWHRQNLLPVYADFLRQVEEELRTPVTAGQVAEWRQTVVAAWAPIAERLAPAVAEVAVTLRPEQLVHLRDAMAKANEKAAREYRPADPAKRVAARYKRLVDRAESLLGDTSDDQKQLMRQSAVAMAANEGAWWQARLGRQKAILDLLGNLSTERPDGEEALRRARLVLADLFVDHDAAAPVPVAPKPGAAERLALRTDLQAASAAGDELTARVLALATPEQRQRMVRRLDGYRQDFRLLAAR